VYGTKHPFYPSIFLPSITAPFCLSIACISLFLGVIAFLYKRSESIISKAFSQLPGNFYLKGLSAGIILLGIFQFSIFQESRGLGSEYLLRPFYENVNFEFPLYKSIATLLSLGVGFKGGEATPLFLIGSHISNSMSTILSIPFPLLAAIGFTCLYHGLSKTPIAGMLMGIELFGISACFCYLICTLIIMYVSGQEGIFKSQIWSSWIPKPMYK
jgi:H+/Cl- antiporter ClcA